MPDISIQIEYDSLVIYKTGRAVGLKLKKKKKVAYVLQLTSGLRAEHSGSRGKLKL